MTRTSLAGVVLAVGFTTAAHAAILVDAPGDGPGQYQGPAPINYYGSFGSRTQESYASSFFSGPAQITGVQFRPYPGASPSGFFSDTVSISELVARFSTTQRGDASGTPLSATFADNVGADVATVFDGAVTLHTAATGTPVRDFDYTLTFATPFLYDPAKGNLLLDFTIPTGAVVSGSGFGFLTFDTSGVDRNGIYSVTNINSGDATSGIAAPTGAITRFLGTPVAVPEPMSIALLGLGVAGVFGLRCRAA